MNYYIVEYNSGEKQTAGIKARDDICKILNNKKYQSIEIESNEYARRDQTLIQKLAFHFKIADVWTNQTQKLKGNDVLIVQFPLREHSILMYRVFEKLIARKIIIVLLIHDLELFRTQKRKETSILAKIRLHLEEKSLLKVASYVVVHNKKMHNEITSLGIGNAKIIELGIFDYLLDDYEPHAENFKKNDSVLIAGNLAFEKAPYAYQLPTNYRFRLYGPNYSSDLNKNHSTVEYMGAFQPDELPYALQGSFGLVWDGESVENCSGIYGEYLKINNPHKASLYLASGLPVIIWDQAALADFITEHQCGITVSSLYDIERKIKGLSDEEYKQLRMNANRIGQDLRLGKYTQNALNEI